MARKRSATAQIALGFSGFLHYSGSEIIQLTQRAEKIGYDSVWVAETRFVDDGMSILAALSTVTKKLRLGNAILGHTFARSTAVLALGAATIDILSKGRLLLGLGPGASYYVSKQGVNVARPLRALSEYVLVIRKLLAGEEVSFNGELVHLDRVRLGIRPIQEIVPIFLGISGPRMLEMAGRISDGVVLNALVTPEYIRKAVELVKKGAEEAGRSLKDIEVSSVIYVSMSNDKSAANALKPMLADYFVHQPHTARDSGLDESTLRKIQKAWNDKGVKAAASAVPDSIVRAINAVGSARECREKIAEYREAGVELPIIFPLPPEPGRIIKEVIK